MQVGMQQRSMPHIIKARELIRAGRIGKVVKVHMTLEPQHESASQRVPLGVDPKQVDWTTFLGTAKKQDFDEYRFRNWRWFWDFGGGIFTDLMVHWIDVAHWILEPRSPEPGRESRRTIQQQGCRETPDTVQTLLCTIRKACRCTLKERSAMLVTAR